MKGYIVTWTPPSVCTRAQARAALSVAGQNADMVPIETAPEIAARRAAVSVASDRKAVAGRIKGASWQLSACVRDDDRLRYERDTVFEVGEDGSLSVKDWGECAHAVQNSFAEARRTMVAGDVSSVVRCIFERSEHFNELIPLRDRGGVYFVPDKAANMVEAARAFVEGVGGKFSSYSVEWQPGDHTEKAIAQAVTDHLYGLLAEFRESMLAAAQCKKPDAAIARRAQHAQDLRAQIASYVQLLGAVSGDLIRKLEAAEVEAATVAAKTVADEVAA